MLEQAGVAPEAVAGTGIGGRITRGDVEEHLRSARPAAPAPAAPAPAAAAPAAAAPASAPSARPQPPATARGAAAAVAAGPVGTDNDVPLNKIRTITAEHMVRSQATSAHAYVSTEVDFERVDRVRQANKESFREEEGFSLTFLPFVALALSMRSPSNT